MYQLNDLTFAHRDNKIFEWARTTIHDLNSRFHLDYHYIDEKFGFTLTAEGVDCICVGDNKAKNDLNNQISVELDLPDISFQETVDNLMFDTASFFNVLRSDKAIELAKYAMWTLVASEKELDLKDCEVREHKKINGFNCYLFRNA